MAMMALGGGAILNKRKSIRGITMSAASKTDESHQKEWGLGEVELEIF